MLMSSCLLWQAASQHASLLQIMHKLSTFVACTERWHQQVPTACDFVCRKYTHVIFLSFVLCDRWYSCMGMQPGSILGSILLAVLPVQWLMLQAPPTTLTQCACNAKLACTILGSTSACSLPVQSFMLQAYCPTFVNQMSIQQGTNKQTLPCCGCTADQPMH